MTVGSERFASRRDTIAFLACLGLSVMVRATPLQWQQAIASSLRSTLLAPFLALQQQAELLRTSRARFARVEAERDSAVVAAAQVDALREENEQLRAALALGARLTVRHIPAEVLHQTLPTDGYTLLLSAGSVQGVRPLLPVIAAGGLVGVIRSVDRHSSVCVVWAHPDFRASAMTADGSVFGIVEPHGSAGPNTMLLELHGVPYQENVPIGTRIYTSGLATGAGGVYPRGIFLGTIFSVGEELAGWARTYLLLPAVHPAAVSHVMILLDNRADLSNQLGQPAP